jgi:serine protease AprX
MSWTTDPCTVLLIAEEISPRSGEGWRLYRERVTKRLEPVRRRAAQALGLQLSPLLAANALYGEASEEAVHRIRAGILGTGISLVEWGMELSCAQMRGPMSEVKLALEAATAPRFNRGLSGRGVSVAVLDSGIDVHHPYLKIAAAVSTCPEPLEVPGWHGTHCAGLIASRSPQFPGVAPGVRLLDVKVSRAGGWLHPAWLARGIDAALDANADILSISVGINRLPATIVDGHGWDCLDGRCLLCRAVDHAVLLGALVVVAAGNEHLRVSRLRALGMTLPGAAELLCPGGAQRALAVGALETYPALRLWPHSSRSRGSGQPALVAPGVELASTILLGKNDHSPNPFALFGTGTGTSVAAAVTAGATALIYERRRASGLSLSPRMVCRELLARCAPPCPSEGIPFRRLDLSTLLASAGSLLACTRPIST